MPYCSNQRYRNMPVRPSCPDDKRPSCPVSDRSACPCKEDSTPHPPCNMVNPCPSCPCAWPLAMAGVNRQRPGSPTYDIETAFMVGTLFKDLNKPFVGKGGCR